jgi:bacillolysin
LTTTHAQTPIPKFAQPDNKSIQKLTVSIENYGWLYFRYDAKVKANDLFTTYREAMGLQSEDKMVLQKTWRDELGYRFNRYNQYYKGIEVLNGVFVESFARNEENVYLANGKLIEGLNVDVSPSIKEADALENAMKHLGAAEFAWQNMRMETELKGEVGADATYLPKGKLVLTPLKSDDYAKENYKFTWQFDITASNPYSRKYVFVDAHSGEIVKVFEPDHHNGPAQLRYYGTQEIDTEWMGGVNFDYKLHANDNFRDICTKTGGGEDVSFYWASNVRDADDVWENDKADATTAHWVVTKAWDFYQNTFNRCGVNGNCEYLRVWSNSTDGTHSWASEWAGRWKIAFGRTITVPLSGDKTDATLDIAGHEFTHGVLNCVEGPGSGINPGDEPAAIGESLCDIMGLMVERTTLGANDAKNFTHSEDCGPVLRNFESPFLVSDNQGGILTQHPTVYNGIGFVTSGGKHHNCSVQNHWFYLLGNGKQGTGTTGVARITVDGIGFDKAAQIVYRSMTTGKLINTSNFADARVAMIQSAKELFGNCSNEVIQTAQAWAKVGVGNPLVCTDPVYVSGSSTYGSVICVNLLDYPYQFYAYDKPGTTFTWNYPSYWIAQTNNSQLTVDNFGSIYDGQSAVISATSSTGEVGHLQLIFQDCSNNQMLKVKNTPVKLSLNVFPNPVSDLLALKSNRKKAGQVQIFDSIGRLMLTKNVGIDEDYIDVSALKNGLYTLKLTVENEFLNVSFYKN